MDTSTHSTKDRILSAAQERMFTQGYPRLSVDELTSELGISKKTFYKIFNTKEQMVEEMGLRLMEDTKRQMKRVVESNMNFVEKLGHLLSVVGGLVRTLDSAALGDLQRHFPDLWNAIAQFRRQRMEEFLLPLLSQGVQEGYVRTDVNQRVFMLVYVAAVQSVIRPSVLIEESFSAQEGVEQIIKIFFAGVMTEAGKREFDQIRPNKQALSV